jgi:hypothetical protein
VPPRLRFVSEFPSQPEAESCTWNCLTRSVGPQHAESSSRGKEKRGIRLFSSIHRRARVVFPVRVSAASARLATSITALLVAHVLCGANLPVTPPARLGVIPLS